MLEDFYRTGVFHVLAISGLHVGFVVAIFFGLASFLRMRYQLRIVLVLLAVGFYVLLVGARPSTVRAGIMAALFLGSYLFQREPNRYNSLALAALLILLFDPSRLYSVGFQLSFAAVFSILYCYPRLETFLPSQWVRAAKRRSATRFLLALIIVSVAAQIGALPVIAYHIGRIPLLVLPANLIAVPLVGLIIAVGMATVVFGLASLPLGAVFANICSLLLMGLTGVIKWLAALPQAEALIPPFSVWLLVVYAAGVIVLLNLANVRARRWLVIYSICVANVTVWHFALKKPEITVTFLDV